VRLRAIQTPDAPVGCGVVRRRSIEIADTDLLEVAAELRLPSREGSVQVVEDSARAHGKARSKEW
jgi:hypothetical protein